MIDRYTEKAQKVIYLSQEIALNQRCNYIGSDHLLLALLKEDNLSSKILNKNGITYDFVEEKIKIEYARNQAEVKNVIGFTPRVKRIFETSLMEAAKMKISRISTYHILIGILKESDSLSVKILETLGASTPKIYNEILVSLEDYNLESYTEEKKVIKTPILDKYSRDLTKLAQDKELDCLIRREREIERIVKIINRRFNNTPCLIGKSGVGKTKLVEGLADYVARGKLDYVFKFKRIVELDLFLLLNSEDSNEIENKMNNIFNEVNKAGNILLFLDNIDLYNTSNRKNINYLEIIKKAINIYDIHIICTATSGEHNNMVKNQNELAKIFQFVKIEEPSIIDTIEILKSLKNTYEKHHQLVLTDSAIIAAVELSNTYIKNKWLPKKAIDIVDTACSNIRFNSLKEPVKISRLSKQLEELERKKISYIMSEMYVDAAEIRCKQKQITEQFKNEKSKWELELSKKNIIVDSADVINIIKEWTGISNLQYS